MSSAPVLSVEGVRKSFGDNEVLHGVSFSLAEGDVLAVIGPSGGGKSTLLRCAVNLEPVTAGSMTRCSLSQSYRISRISG